MTDPARTRELQNLIRSVRKTISSFSDPEMKRKAVRIGLLLVNSAKLEIRKQRLIKTSRLFNSIQYRTAPTQKGAIIEFGSFGVPYAAVHEFGFRGVVNVNAHERRRIGRKSGKSYVQRVRSHSRRMNVPKRPFLRPAIDRQLPRIEEIIGSGFDGT